MPFQYAAVDVSQLYCPQRTVCCYCVIVLKMYNSKIKTSAIDGAKQCTFTKCTFMYGST